MSTLSSAFKLLKEGRFKDFFSIALGKFLKIENYQVDYFDFSEASGSRELVNGYTLEMDSFTGENSKKLFSNWPDSDEELRRHKKLCELYGSELEILTFKRKGQQQVEHFHFYLDPSSEPRNIPAQVLKLAKDKQAVLRIRVYTFENSRGNKLGKQSLEPAVQYLVDRFQGILAWRGELNRASIKMSESSGFKKIASMKRVALPSQKGMEGIIKLNQ